MSSSVDNQPENNSSNNKQHKQEEQGRKCKGCSASVDSGSYCEKCRKKNFDNKNHFAKGNKIGWQKGQSGNPKGRPKIGFREAVERAMEKVEEESGMSLMESIVRRAFKSDPLAIAILRKYLPDLNNVEGEITLKDIMATLVGDKDEDESI